VGFPIAVPSKGPNRDRWWIGGRSSHDQNTAASAPLFFAKAEMGSVRFQRRKMTGRFLAFGCPRSSCVRFAAVLPHGGIAPTNDFTPCRDALCFPSACASRADSGKTPGATATRGSSYTTPLALRFLYSSNESVRADTRHRFSGTAKAPSSKPARFLIRAARPRRGFYGPTKSDRLSGRWRQRATKGRRMTAAIMGLDCMQSNALTS